MNYLLKLLRAKDWVTGHWQQLAMWLSSLGIAWSLGWFVGSC